MTTQQEKTPITDRGLKPQIGVKKFAVGVDWLTVTTPTDKQGFVLYDIAREYWKQNGATSVEWRNKWYEGRTALGCTWGFGTYGWLLMASGEAAPYVWKKGLLSKSRITRIDLQVTAELDRPVPNLPEDWYNDIRRQRKYTQRRQYGLIQNTGGGQTLYAGSRQSAQYGRFYDKGVESKSAGSGKLYRYEVELKKPLAGSLADYLITSLQDGIYPEKELLWYVYNWWLDRGVVPVFNPKKTDLIKLTAIKVTTDNDKKLAWLKNQVAPTVGKLIDAGLEDDILDALGLKILLDRIDNIT